jgi:hypothetical protein
MIKGRSSMYLDNNNNFYGKIGGKHIGNFLNFNYKLNTCEERIAFVNEVLEMYKVDGVEFYHEYFDEVYDQERKHSKIDLVIDKSKSTYTTSNIASSLELIANYILAVDDVDDKVNYKIYTSEELFKRACQEFNVINDVAKANGGLDMKYEEEGNKGVEAFPFFQLPKNYKKVKDLKLEKEDLEKYPPMKDYYEFYNYLKEESKRLWGTKNLSKEDMVRRGKIKKLLPEIKKDMMDAKKQLQMPIIWKSPLKDDGGADYDLLDMFDKEVVKELLRVHKGVDLQDDLSCILVDLENLINKIEFTDKQRKVLELWSNGLTTGEISKKLKLNPSTITKCLNGVVDLIVKQYEKEYEEWYYLNIRKGEYKRCNRCKNVKLVSQFDKNGKKGLRSCCKKCESLRKSK